MVPMFGPQNVILVLTGEQAGRIGLPILLELHRSGYEVSVLTRDATRLKDIPAEIKIQQVDYDSDHSLVRALQGQDALISTVAMSAISRQPRMIDAAIAAGVRIFIPAEYTVNSRDATAQMQPMMSSVVAIQDYLATKEDEISWFVINCGALLEFVLDHPVILDFEKRSATLWDGGEGAISLSDIPLLARAVSAALKQPDRVLDHRVKIHGGTITQNQALEIAKQASESEWTAQHEESQTAYSTSMESLNTGTADTPMKLMAAMLTAYNAASFWSCDGHFESAYREPDNSRLGVEEFINGEVVEAIRKKAAGVSYGSGTDGVQLEHLSDVTGELATIHAGKQ
ncbi:hypothetical protein Q7P36_003489 [Cladosporium allicinum]